VIHTPVEGSSNVRSTGHEGSVMQVTYAHGGTYEFPNVDKEQYDRFLAAESAGKFLNSWGIKGTKLQDETL
jgi:ribosomal protein L25 (general stress protein Ctc)